MLDKWFPLKSTRGPPTAAAYSANSSTGTFEERSASLSFPLSLSPTLPLLSLSLPLSLALSLPSLSQSHIYVCAPMHLSLDHYLSGNLCMKYPSVRRRPPTVSFQPFNMESMGPDPSKSAEKYVIHVIFMCIYISLPLCIYTYIYIYIYIYICSLGVEEAAPGDVLAAAPPVGQAAPGRQDQRPLLYYYYYYYYY